MNQRDFLKAFSKEANLSQRDSSAALAAITRIVTETIMKGESVTFLNLGKLSVKLRAAREGRNPVTGERIPVPARCVPAFKASTALRTLVSCTVKPQQS